MNTKHLFERYELLVAGADKAFSKMGEDYAECIKCRPHCSDCCHAVFGIFLIEAVYLKHCFDGLEAKKRDAVFARGEKSENKIAELQNRLKSLDNDPNKASLALARERIRCALLDDGDECILYTSRPITCRVYGIPTAIQGRAHVCGKSAFDRSEVYPTFDLDSVYRELYSLSRELLEAHGSEDLEKASLLISVPKVIKTPQEDLLNEEFE